MTPVLAILFGLSSALVFLITVMMGNRVPMHVVFAGFILAITSIAMSTLYLFGAR